MRETINYNERNDMERKIIPVFRWNNHKNKQRNKHGKDKICKGAEKFAIFRHKLASRGNDIIVVPTIIYIAVRGGYPGNTPVISDDKPAPMFGGAP